MMNATKTFSGLAALALMTTVVQAANAEEAPKGEVESKCPISAEVGVDILSCYMWRGQILSDVPVWQPSVTLGYDLGDYGALSANVWSSFRLTSRRDGTPVKAAGNQEVDYTISYAKSFGDWDFELGHIWYTYPNTRNDANTEEIYLTVAYNNDIVTPSATVYWDYRDNDEDWIFYGNLSLSHDFELVDKLTLTPYASLGLGTDAYLRNLGLDESRTAFLDQTIGASLAYAVTDWMTVSGQINYTWIVDHDARKGDYMGRGEDNRVWGGVNVTFAF